jgi:hypothetical protein
VRARSRSPPAPPPLQDVAAQVVQQTGVGHVRFQSRDGHTVAEITGMDRDAVYKAAIVMGMHLEAQAGFAELRKKEARLRNQERLLEDEKASGLRVEFPVPSEVLGLVIGKGGANIDRVTEESGVDKIAVDSESDPCMVRIKGATREAVSKARRMLECVDFGPAAPDPSLPRPPSDP